MSLLAWSKDYCIGNNLVDSQHVKLFSILNRLYDGFKRNNCSISYEHAVSRVISYAHYHFSAEENLMQEAGYPDFVQHVQEHRLFLEKVMSLKGTICAADKEIASSLIEFLVNWILHHILVEDKKIAEYLL